MSRSRLDAAVCDDNVAASADATAKEDASISHKSAADVAVLAEAPISMCVSELGMPNRGDGVAAVAAEAAEAIADAAVRSADDRCCDICSKQKTIEDKF